VPVGSVGDNFDRYAVRLEEMRQSMRILEQAMDRLPAGPILLDDARVALPPKREVYNTIESMIAHFKLIMDGIVVPPGEIYSFTEGGNGELGFYIVSDGTGRPWKCACGRLLRQHRRAQQILPGFSSPTLSRLSG